MSKLLYQGHSSCAGCPETIAIRNILDVAGPNTIISNVTGCTEIVSTPYPTTSWAVPYIHVAFETAASVASGIEAAMKKLGKSDLPDKSNLTEYVTYGNTMNHTNEPVMIYVTGKNAEIFDKYEGKYYPQTELIDNTDIFNAIKEIAGLK